MPELSLPEWDDFLSHYPDAHVLQTGAWGELKSEFGWDVARLRVESGEKPAAWIGAQVLFRRLPFALTLAYIPKGPVGCDNQTALEPTWQVLRPAVDDLCRSHKAVFLKVEPDLWDPLDSQDEAGDAQGGLPPQGFQLSQQDIQPSRTLLVDLRGSEEQVLARMKQKTRYNIRLALKKGVVVSSSQDIDRFYRLLALTGKRDRFGVHSLEYYRQAYELFRPRGECELLVAGYQGEVLGAIMIFAHGQRAWYFYGASADEHRDRMPTYLLQWEAMRWARGRGCTSYDLWGVPDDDETTLEANFMHISEGLWGVYRFKRGFGGQLRHAAGPWDRVYRPVWYAFYRLWTARRARLS